MEGFEVYKAERHSDEESDLKKINRKTILIPVELYHGRKKTDTQQTGECGRSGSYVWRPCLWSSYVFANLKQLHRIMSRGTWQLKNFENNTAAAQAASWHTTDFDGQGMNWKISEFTDEEEALSSPLLVSVPYETHQKPSSSNFLLNSWTPYAFCTFHPADSSLKMFNSSPDPHKKRALCSG